MPEPITTNTVKAPLRPGQGKQEKRQVFMSMDHPVKKMDTSYDLNRYPTVIKRTQKTGLPPLQTQDLRAMAENKKRVQALIAQRAARAKTPAVPKPKRKAPKVNPKGRHKKGK